MSYELRLHGESYGWEAQFFERDEPFYSRDGFVMRELAIQWARPSDRQWRKAAQDAGPT
jgi:hypothetical protein